MTLLAPIQRHIEALAHHDGFPAEAVEACIARPDASVPILRALLQRAARGTPLGDADAARLFVGIHILAGLRDEQSFAPLMRLLGQPTEVIDDLLGDTVSASLSKILASTFDGDADLLFESIADLSINEEIRDSLWRAATILVSIGRIDRERIRDFIIRFDAERLAPKKDFAWIGWLNAIADLGFDEIAARVGAVWIDQRLPEDIVTRAEFDRQLAAAVAAPDDPERLAKAGLGLIDDVATALAWADWDGPPQPIVNPMRGVGRNDPCPCGSGRKAKKCCLANG